MKLYLRMYQLLLHACPKEVRRKLGPEMLRTFQDRMEREGTARLALLEGADLMVTGFRERLAARRARRGSRPRKGNGSPMELFFKDLRHGSRSLLRSPAYAIASVVSLALGIGANTAVFSLVNAVLLKPMPVGEPDELVAVYATRGSQPTPLNFSYPNYRDLSESGIFSDLVGFQGANVSVQPASGEPEIAWCELVTENYFFGLRVPTTLGRTFLREDAHRPVVVLSYDFWNRRFSGRESVLGSTLRINGHDFEVVGVAGRSFTGAKFLGFTPELWIPITMNEVAWPGDENRLDRRQGAWLNVRGRLLQGTSLAEGRAALETAAARLASEYPDVNRDWSLHLYPAPRKTEPYVEVQMGSVLPVASTALLVITGIVLLVACANVTSLTLSRMLSRERELALRLSLGATRPRLVRQILLESLLLALAAATAGWCIAQLTLKAALGLHPVLDFSIDYGVEMDWRVISFTVIVTLFAALFSGMVPTLGAARRELTFSLKEGVGVRRRRWRRFLVVPQIALSFLALVSASLFVRSFRNLSSFWPGFDSHGLLLASVDPELQSYDEARRLALYESLRQRLKTLPGVEAVSYGFPLPLDAYSEGDRIRPEASDQFSTTTTEEKGKLVLYSAVGVDYFQSVGTPIVEGRSFRSGDDAGSRPVAVVNETLARSFWPGESPIGKRFQSGASDPSVEVVGVARDGKYVTLGEEPRPYFFVPVRQRYESPMTVVIRTLAPPKSLEASLRSEVRALDPTLPVYGVRTMEEFLSRSLAGARALALATTVFAGLAVALATVGLYGLMSFSVSQQRHDLGIRMAIGASKRDVMALFLAQAARVIGAGIALGLVLAWASTRFLESLLIGVGSANVATLVEVSLFLGLVASAGSFLPTWRATKLDPLAVLRHE